MTAHPPAVRALVRTVTDAVTAAQDADGAAFAEASQRLDGTDHERLALVLGGVVRRLLEQQHPDGLDGDDVRDVLVRCATAGTDWFEGLDVDALLAVLAGALGVLEAPTPVADDDPDDPFPPEPVTAPPSAADVDRHAALVVAELLRTSDGPLRAHLDAVLDEVARDQTVELP